MKRIFILFFVLFVFILCTNAQVGINTDNSTPDPSAMLDVKSITKGMLVPRMTAVERNAISNPASGLLVFCIDNNQYYANKGTPSSPNWIMVSSQWMTSGSDLYFTGGKLGVGITNPVYHLDVAGDVNYSGTLRNNGIPVVTGVSGVTATLPLVSSGGNNPNISIPLATSLADGFLSHTDWGIFNAKQSALTIGNVSSGDIAITGGIGAVIGSGMNLNINKGNLTEISSSILTINNGTGAVLGPGTTIQVKQANTGQSGFLSSTDWNNFNNKVSSQWVSQGQDISYNTGKVGIGTSTPASSASLEVTSTNAGVLLPRMTRVQRNAIVSPAEGLMVYCTNCGTNGSLSIFTSGSWMTFSPCTINPPVSGIHLPSQGQIIWNWLAVPGAIGYKWSATPDYETATDMGASLSKTETGTICNITYSRYIWAYSGCGESGITTLTQVIPMAAPGVPSTGTNGPTLTSITWKWNSVAGATGYKWGLTNNYSSATDIGTATSTTETGLTCSTAYTRYIWAYNGCGSSTSGTLTQTTWACGTCGTITVNHTAGTVAPVSKTVTYGTVINVPGETSKCWITSNLGADHQATAVNDATEASAGWYWQFNLKQGFKHDGTTRTPNTTWISSISENSDWSAANDPCAIELGSGWRIPTYTEWNNVDIIGSWNNWNGPWNSGLNIHSAGRLNQSSGSLEIRGANGYYWTSTQYSVTNAYHLGFSPGDCAVYGPGTSKTMGFNLRCIKE